MGVEWAEALEKGISFGIRPKRWLQFLVVDFVFLAILLAYALSNITQAVMALAAAVNPLMLMSMISSVVVFIVLVVLWMLAKLLVMGALIQQGYKEKEKIEKTYQVAKSKYLTLLVTGIVLGVVGTLLAVVPFIGTVLTLAFSIVFFFVYQSVIIKGKGFVVAMKESYNIFRKHIKPIDASMNWRFLLLVIMVIVGVALGSMAGMASPGNGLALFVIIAFFSWLLIYSNVGDVWALITVVMGIIVMIFAVPALLLLGAILLPALAGAAGVSSMAALILMFTTNLPLILVVLAIFLVGTSIGSAFSLKATVEFYKQMR